MLLNKIGEPAMNKNKYISIVILLFITLGASSQTKYIESISIDKRFHQKNNEANIDLTFVLDNLDMKPEHFIVLTPVVQSANKQITKTLPPVVIAGKKRYKVISRAKALNNQLFEAEPYSIVKRNNKKPQSVDYHISIPMEGWMAGGSLSLNEKVSGCANCELGNSHISLLPRLVNEIYNPDFGITYIEPEEEVQKKRKEVHELYLKFKVGKYNILEDFGNNRVELDRLKSFYDHISNNNDVSITSIKVTGYASPEGDYDYNMNLSKKRAESLISYIKKQYNANPSLITAEWKGEDWEGLTKLVKASSLEDKDKVLDIIATTGIKQGREKAIMNLSGGSTYQTMLKEMFPNLRSNVCHIEYTVAGFDADKAKQLLYTNPQLLSVAEMYMVAGSYPKGSAEYNRVLITAAKTFPNHVEAVNNAAGIEIKRGNIDKAISMLNQIKENPASWNNMGVALAMNKDYNNAKEYFSKASDKGNKEASANLIQLEKVIKSLLN
jgi:tetratricopeptide (TPR) repeat protein